MHLIHLLVFSHFTCSEHGILDQSLLVQCVNAIFEAIIPCLQICISCQEVIEAVLFGLYFVVQLANHGLCLGVFAFQHVNGVICGLQFMLLGHVVLFEAVILISQGCEFHCCLVQYAVNVTDLLLLYCLVRL